MSSSLPDRPDLNQLRRQAKELRDAARRGEPDAIERMARHHQTASHAAVSLAAAQLVIARELGVASWPRLKAAVEARAHTSEGLAAAFLAASVERRPREASAILQAHPGIAAHSVHAAAVSGDAAAVGEMLATKPSAAMALDDARGWPPLLYACYSRWHEIDSSRAAGLAEVVGRLLEAGASVHTNNGARTGYRSALCGAVEVNNPDVTQVLLDAGANPDDGRCVVQAAGHRDHRCLELLLARGARVAGTWAIGAAVYADNPHAVSLLIDALRATTGQTANAATSGLADAAAANSSHEVVAALLAAGADPETRDSDLGLSALRAAVRAGQPEAAALLVSHGARDDSTDVDRLIGACRRADRVAAEQLLAEHPDLPQRLTADDRTTVVDAAADARPAVVALLLECGFSPEDRNGSGEQALHTAAYHGNAEVVALLIDAGADVDGRDARFDATPLAFATVGSGERDGRPGDWVGTVRLLVNAGASRHDVWVSGKPPSEEVIALLRTYGIAPDDESEFDSEGESEGDDAEDARRSIGTGVMADIAHHLAAAYRNRDLDLLGSLLHPQVRWTGLCNTSGEVLDWYRSLLADGTRAAVESMEVDRDAVVLGLTLSRPAIGARPASPERLYQVFMIDNGEIIRILGYSDRAAALARA
ncbi:MAG TPA: ankyrin repeat domain-containing protein [Pseudonocardiaceae bacterium]|jgi:ankyrin repeat protein|nr:ankyrin repeat domain-containing protein [Pseudonocardiaceae bacterium]